MSSIMDNLRKVGHAVGSKKSVNLILTPLGEQKANNFNLPPQQSLVITIIKDNQPCTVREIAREAQMPYDKAKAICKGLVRDEYVRKTNASSE